MRPARSTAFRRTTFWCGIAVSAMAALSLGTRALVDIPQVEARENLRTTDLSSESPSLSATLTSLGRQFLGGEIALAVQLLVASLLMGGIITWSLLQSKDTFGRRALALTVSVLMSEALGVLVLQDLPELLDAVPLLSGSLIGTIVGIALRTGRRTVATFLVGGAGLAVVLSLGAIGLLFLLTAGGPAGFESSAQSAAQKQKLIDRLKKTQLLSQDPTKPREIRLNESEANLLLGWKLGAGDRAPVRARVFIGEDSFLLLASKGWHLPVFGERYLNAYLTGGIRVDAGQLQLDILNVQVGRLRATPGMRTRLERLLVPGLQTSVDMQPWLRSLESLRLQSGNVEMRTQQVRESALAGNHFLNGVTYSASLRQATIDQVEHLTQLLQTLPGRTPFEPILADIFEQAYKQSRELNPRDANRAALLALGIVFVDVNLARLIDYSVTPELREVIRRRAGRVRLRNRSDWVQHFCGSAALAATAGRSISNLAGLIKEEIDAGIPGKGFSFGDVMADRAGTRFAHACLNSEEGARRMLDRLRKGISIEDLFPSAAGLPEGITERELTANYGGVGGLQYRQWLEDIEKRLDQAPLLKAP